MSLFGDVYNNREKYGYPLQLHNIMSMAHRMKEAVKEMSRDTSKLSTTDEETSGISTDSAARPMNMTVMKRSALSLRLFAIHLNKTQVISNQELTVCVKIHEESGLHSFCTWTSILRYV